MRIYKGFAKKEPVLKPGIRKAYNITNNLSYYDCQKRDSHYINEYYS